MSTYPHFGTNAIHVGQDPEQWNCKALVPPIFTTTTYKQDEPGKPVRIIVTYCSFLLIVFFLSFCFSPPFPHFLPLSIPPSFPPSPLPSPLPPLSSSLCHLSPSLPSSLPSPCSVPFLLLSLPQPMHDYIREGNPTRTALEKSVAACEGAQYGM